MNTNQKYQFRQQSENESNQPLAGKQSEDPQKGPGKPIPDDPTIPEPPDENPDHNSQEPGINDPTRIDEEQPIFNDY
jgi:hypothetical protein